MIGKKEFAATILNLGDEAFIVYIAFLSIDTNIHLSHKAQIALLKPDEAPIDILSKYTEFADIFSSALAAKLSEHTRINNYAMDLIKGK